MARNPHSVEDEPLLLRTVPVVYPQRLRRSPDEYMSMHTDLLRLQEVDHGTGRGTSPEPVPSRGVAAKGRPERSRILVVAEGAPTSRHRLVRGPVERHRGLVEEAAMPVARLVDGIGLVRSELVEVEDVGSEPELMRYLLDLDRRAGRDRKPKLACRLAVALDVFVDAPLLGGVPDRPIRRAHGIRTASRRQSALRCSARRCNGGKGTGERNDRHSDPPKHSASDHLMEIAMPLSFPSQSSVPPLR